MNYVFVLLIVVIGSFIIGAMLPFGIWNVPVAIVWGAALYFIQQKYFPDER